MGKRIGAFCVRTDRQFSRLVSRSLGLSGKKKFLARHWGKESMEVVALFRGEHRTYAHGKVPSFLLPFQDVLGELLGVMPEFRVGQGLSRS